MAEVCSSQIVRAEQMGTTSSINAGKNQGSLKIDGKNHAFFIFSDTESASEAVNKFLQEVNTQEDSLDLLDYEFFPITQEIVELETEKEALLQLLFKQQLPGPDEEIHSSLPQQNPQNGEKQNKTLSNQTSTYKPSNFSSQNQGPSKLIHSSLFSLARTFHTSLAEARQKKEIQKQDAEPDSSKLCKIPLQSANVPFKVEDKQIQQSRYEREGNGKQEREKQDQDQENDSNPQNKNNQENPDKKNKKNKIPSITKVQTARSPASLSANRSGHESDKSAVPQEKPAQGPLGSMESIYIRFMALMARILGQAELEAHQLYLRIKERTDAIDTLTLLISKINAEKGAIDWSNNEELKTLVNKARALGVEIPEGKEKWTEDEKKLLKENIQLRKDSMEKMTQLERTDMQRYLQEASQCHQARSNVLKLLKEVVDTFIHNIRPG